VPKPPPDHCHRGARHGAVREGNLDAPNGLHQQIEPEWRLAMSLPPGRMLPPHREYQSEVSGRMRLVLGLSLVLAIGTAVGFAADWQEIRPLIQPSGAPPAVAPLDR
jgi:hypothetical protein